MHARWVRFGASMMLLLGCGALEGPLLRRVAEEEQDDGRDAGEVSLPFGQDVTWQYQLSGTLDLSVDAQLLVVDLFALEAARVTELREDGKVLIAYLSAGTHEPYRADAAEFPERVLGNSHPGYPDERWLDIRDDAVRERMRVRLQHARERGFDGVLPTNLAGYARDTGFALTATDQRAYNQFLARQARALGLLVGLSDDFAQAEQLAPDFDWAMHVGCIARDDCGQLAPFGALGKPMLNVELSGEASEVCERAAQQGINVLLKRPRLDAYRVACP